MDIANDLTTSYYQLQTKVDTLTEQLAQASRERYAELVEKECIANRLQHLLSVLPTGVIVLNEQGIIQECNLRAQGLLGENLIGSEWRLIIEKQIAPQDDDGHEISLKDGRKLNILTCALGGAAGQIIVINDLTQTRALQEQLSHDRHLKEMGKMVASMAHQIRTPLATALIYSKYMLEDELSLENRQSFGRKLVLKLHHMEHQVRDMLIFAKGEAINLYEMKVDQFVSVLVTFISDQVNEHEIDLIIKNNTKDEVFCVHEYMLLGAIHNIVHNAIESSDKKVKINITVTKKINDIYIKIKDDGPGMSSDILKKIEHPFFTTRMHGTGLGLAVVRAVIKAHSGHLNIESVEDVGTTVIVTIPTAEQ